jgi:hypothetical protein
MTDSVWISYSSMRTTESVLFELYDRISTRRSQVRVSFVDSAWTSSSLRVGVVHSCAVAVVGNVFIRRCLVQSMFQPLNKL